MPDVIIIGAGLTGLACAWRLKQLGVEAQILESSNRAGGVVRTERIDGYLVEWGPNTFRPTPETLSLLDEAGLASRIVMADRRAPRFVCFGHRLRKAPFGPMSSRGVVRAAAELFIRSKSAAGESVHDFFIRRFGQQAQDRLVAPFLTGIYAGDTRQLSMAAVFPTLVEMERRHGSLMFGMFKSRKPKGTRGGGTASFKDGMEELPRRLACDLDIQYQAKNIRIDLGLRPDGPALGDKRKVIWHGGMIETKAVVVTTPAAGAAEILQGSLPEASRQLNQIQYAPMTVAISSLPSNAFRKPLRGFGFLVPRSEKLHILGTMFSSSLFPDRATDGRVLLTTFIGGAHEPETIDWPDSRIWDVVRGELQMVLKTSTTPDRVDLIRHRHAIPQYTIGHEQRVAAIRRELKTVPGLFLDGNYLDGISVSACLDNGARTARAVMEFIRSQP